MSLLVLHTLSVGFAAECDNLTSPPLNSEELKESINITSNMETKSSDNKDKILNDPYDEQPDAPDLIIEERNYVNPSNIKMYFKDGVLNKEFAGKTLTFTGNFDNLGQLTINSDDVSIIGENANFKNTVFSIESCNIILKNLTFDSDTSIKSNNGAVIRINGDYVTLTDLKINYVVPNDVEAYAILADGYNGYSSENLKILNSYIYFEGHNDNVFKYNCAVKLVYANYAIVENNTIETSLPLKKVLFEHDGASLNSDYAYAVGLEESHDFIIKNNTIITNVNKRTAVDFPTLNSIMLSKSDNGLFLNNSIYMTDFVTFPGVENYLYALDIYKLNNLLVMGNKISVVTTGGKLALGTAYPIQICGPISGIRITENDLYSFSNGPNIGIYSQNFYGDTDLSITNNKINVTGLAGTHEWALVAGIESQDTNAEIHNNIIEVHSIAAVNVDDNLYAISYRQSTAGDHTFDIQNNLAFTDGFYAIYLLSSKYSLILNNTLISYNDNAETGSDSYRQGFGEHDNDRESMNNVINAKDYYGHKNVIEINSNGNLDISNNIDGRDIGHDNQNLNIPESNPSIPNFIDPKNINNNGQGLIDSYEDDGSSQGTISNIGGFNGDSPQDATYPSNDKNENAESLKIDSKNIGETDMKGFDIATNGSQTPAIGTSDNLLAKSQSASHSSGESESVSKSFEINKVNKEDFVPSAFLVVIVMLLLMAGYKRRNEMFNK